MVFFLGSLLINCSLKLDHLHQKHFSSTTLSTSLFNFESEVSNSLLQLLLSLGNSNQSSSSPTTTTTTTLTFPWIHNCFKILIPNLQKAFMNLISDIDYPMTNWEMILIDEYLNYTFKSMEFLNSITSSITNLDQALMTLSHALSLVESSASFSVLSGSLKPIKRQPCTSSKKHYYENQTEKKQVEMRFSSEKEFVVHQALMIKKSVCNWVFRVVEFSISGNVQMGMEIELPPFSSSLVNLQLSSVSKVMREEMGALKEVADINETVGRIRWAVAGAGGRGSEEQIDDEVNELKGKLKVLGKLVEDVKEDVNSLFSQVLLRRNEFVDSFQQRKNNQK